MSSGGEVGYANLKKVSILIHFTILCQFWTHNMTCCVLDLYNACNTNTNTTDHLTMCVLTKVLTLITIEMLFLLLLDMSESAGRNSSVSSISSISLVEIKAETHLVLRAFLHRTVSMPLKERPGTVGGLYRDHNQYRWHTSLCGLCWICVCVSLFRTASDRILMSIMLGSQKHVVLLTEMVHSMRSRDTRVEKCSGKSGSADFRLWK